MDENCVARKTTILKADRSYVTPQSGTLLVTTEHPALNDMELLIVKVHVKVVPPPSVFAPESAL
jgi:hypothetical protein